MRPNITPIYLVIAAVLGMQLSTFRTGTKVWPFMAYCMYAESWPKAEAWQRSLFAELADGQSAELTPELFGLHYYGWDRHVLNPLADDQPESVGEAIKLVQKVIAKVSDQPVVAVYRQTTTHRVGDEGIEIIISDKKQLWPKPAQENQP